ncbi:hypothetical protein FACS18949_08130 [Clostridia bacterium]|nr:hypothetical protein FACS18949_08130 [Clostridia bacterium]
MDALARKPEYYTDAHQRVAGNLHGLLWTFLRGKRCQVRPAPYAVRLNAKLGDDTVVVPDLAVICDPGKIDKRGCVGAPDLVIEVLSPSTAAYDKLVKYNKYLQAGVREYWIVDTEFNIVNAFIAKDGEWVARAYGEEDTIPVTVLEGCEIDLKEVFAE